MRPQREKQRFLWLLTCARKFRGVVMFGGCRKLFRRSSFPCRSSISGNNLFDAPDRVTNLTAGFACSVTFQGTFSRIANLGTGFCVAFQTTVWTYASLHTATTITFQSTFDISVASLPTGIIVTCQSTFRRGTGAISVLAGFIRHFMVST